MLEAERKFERHLPPAPEITMRFLPFLAAATVSLSGSLGGQTVPTPESVFGHRVGADFKLIDYGQSIDYFKRLGVASNKIKLIEVGKSSNGVPWTLALISSPENLAKIDRLKEIA